MSQARIEVLLEEPAGTISRFLHGQFAEHLGGCVAGGLWVGEDCPIANVGGIRRDVLEALRELRIPILRWPGGCYADDYDWRDGIGPRRDRPRTVNLWWGQGIEDNQFGTHEFLHLCRLLGAEPYLAGNLGSGTPRQLRDWVEYCNYGGNSTLGRQRASNGSPAPFGVRYWGVGNEAWGCGGSFCPEDYAAEYKRYVNFLHDLSGTPLFLVAVGPNGNDPNWTERFFTKLGRFDRIHAFAAHYYTWNREGTYGAATDFSLDQYYGLLHKGLAAEELIEQQRRLMDRFDPQRRIALLLDEWGAWHPPTTGRDPHHLWQQNTMRDAILAAMTLDIFHRQADKLHMANIAQLANVLQAMVLTEEDRLALTPTYHVFRMYRGHQGGQGVRLAVDAPAIAFAVGGKTGDVPTLSGSASRSGSVLTLSVVNAHAGQSVEAEIILRGGRFGELRLEELAHADIHAHNTVACPDMVRPRRSVLGLSGTSFAYTFAPASVTVFELGM